MTATGPLADPDPILNVRRAACQGSIPAGQVLVPSILRGPQPADMLGREALERRAHVRALARGLALEHLVRAALVAHHVRAAPHRQPARFRVRSVRPREGAVDVRSIPRRRKGR